MLWSRSLRGVKPKNPKATPWPTGAYYGSAVLHGSPLPIGGGASLESTRRSLPQAVLKQLQGFIPVANIAVQWGDMDVFGHVNNVNYARYFETGRIAYLDHVFGPVLGPQEYTEYMAAKGVGIIAKSITLTYRLPVEYPDVLTIGIRVPSSSIQVDRFTQEMVLVSHRREKVATEGSAVLVAYDYKEGKKANLDKRLSDALKRSEMLGVALYTVPKL
ncbi:HotDog domain-containing protein [Cladochytrium replicatum]|nr:HotDog domain-containing protein [Cladochytrium replicatum]